MRSQTSRFSSSSRKTQLATSMAVRPQPRQISSYNVEHTATQGEPDGVRLCEAMEAASRYASDAFPVGETGAAGAASNLDTPEEAIPGVDTPGVDTPGVAAAGAAGDRRTSMASMSLVDMDVILRS